jgi:hypothetical protein
MPDQSKILACDAALDKIALLDAPSSKHGTEMDSVAKALRDTAISISTHPTPDSLNELVEVYDKFNIEHDRMKDNPNSDFVASMSSRILSESIPSTKMGPRLPHVLQKLSNMNVESICHYGAVGTMFRALEIFSRDNYIAENHYNQMWHEIQRIPAKNQDWYGGDRFVKMANLLCGLSPHEITDEKISSLEQVYGDLSPDNRPWLSNYLQKARAIQKSVIPKQITDSSGQAATKNLQELKSESPDFYESLKSGGIFNVKVDESFLGIDIKDKNEFRNFLFDENVQDAIASIIIADIPRAPRSEYEYHPSLDSYGSGGRESVRQEIPLKLRINDEQTKIVLNQPDSDTIQLQRTLDDRFNEQYILGQQEKGLTSPPLLWKDRESYISYIDALKNKTHAIPPQEASSSLKRKRETSSPQRTTHDGGRLSSSGPSALSPPPNSGDEMEGVEGSAEQSHQLRRASSNAPSSHKSDVEMMEEIESSVGPTRPRRAAAIAASDALLRQHPTSPRNPGGPSRQGPQRR